MAVDPNQRQGLYDPQNEHDACGVSFVCNISGKASHDVVSLGARALCNLEHRGALGADPLTGDGAGILIQIPDRFLRDVVDYELPPAGQYATGIGFLPAARDDAEKAASQVERIVRSEGLHVIGWREVPVDISVLGSGSRAAMPSFRQVFIAGDDLAGIDLDRRVYIVRKRIEHEIGPGGAGYEAAEDDEAAMGNAAPPHTGVYFPSLSARTLVYKGMLISRQLTSFYLDLSDERIESALALVHSRFSTNTFPSWPLAHPYRMIAHNGEINTIAGNRNWMRARETLLSSPSLEGLERAFPICTPGASDTAGFDEVLELLTLGGYSLAEAVLMMIPEPWEHHAEMSPERKAFYRFQATRMEPWDGPASIAFTDGTVIGAVLDRNGLRPSRYMVTNDGLVVMASETGVIDVPQSSVVEKGRLQPGRMFLIDTAEGRIVRDDEIKDRLASARPYGHWLDQNLVHLADLPRREVVHRDEGSLIQRQQMFGHTHEEHRLLLAPMVIDGKEALGSMGTDTPPAVLSGRQRPIYDFFKQLFAQVTNPPLDAIREELVTSLYARVGPEDNLFDPKPSSCRTVHLGSPVITDEELARLVGIDGPGGLGDFQAEVLAARYAVADGGEGLRLALDGLCEAASEAISAGANILVVSDRGSDERMAPIPSLLAVSAVHQHLVRERTRTRVGLVSESGDAREVHHLCLHLGYGANAVNPYLAFETISQMVSEGLHGLDRAMGVEAAHRNFVKAACTGILKVMSKMGISTVASYTGAQIFEAIGLGPELVDKYFTGTASRLGGIGLDEIAAAVAARHRRAFPANPTGRAHRTIEAGGEYQWRREGEYHLFNPETVFKLQHATRDRRFDIFGEYTRRVDDQSQRLGTLRGLFRLRTGARPPVPLNEVEPVAEIVKRFATGAMSYGSISKEAHETLAIAMNRIGGKSNTGEGGEDADRYIRDPNGDLRRSAVKQAASGRFGVTSEYLVNSDDIQIKMAQGAKPGEGGQLP
ncbi:MAG: glutamate synthase-related protein, partial [Acidimicrobiaceae bacterium]|nr:glutamate synthase-related protein [Acidimicrobiaceae bacterium]